MTLLCLERVCRRHHDGGSERLVLNDVSMSLDAGELLAIWGMRRSGRSTLLRVAAGIEPADAGVVRFAGRELRGRKGRALGDGIGYCHGQLRDREAHNVLEELMLGARVRGVAYSDAKTRARAALERVGARECAGRGLHTLDGGEAVRVSLARALVLQPALLVIDEPVTGVDLLERDDVLSLLRSLADEGIAVLMSVGESTEFADADRALKIDGRGLTGSVDPELASVHHLRREATA
jgi:ABC-type multidrug transport system ATPase subunit